MNEHHEYQLRRRAIRLTFQGRERTAILARIPRSPAWLSKWLRRFEQLGWQGLRSRSRAPHNRSAHYSHHTRHLIVAARQRLHINTDLVAYCAQEQISFTRGRPYEKNNQCFVEQKNGAVVRQFVGYDRFEGEAAYRHLVEVYRALRLYVNFFQPSLKLKEKHRQGTTVRRTYAPAQTPFERLCAASILTNELETRLEAIFTALDPIRLLDQIGRLQEALWQHAVVRTSDTAAPPLEAPVRFAANACGLTNQPGPADAPAAPIVRQKRAYHRKHPQIPRWWRSRVDPFAEVWTDIEQWLEANPSRTAKSIFVELQQRYPDRYPAVQLRTRQRRIAKWRASVITTFDDQWLQEEVLADATLPRPLRASTAPDGIVKPSSS